MSPRPSRSTTSGRVFNDLRNMAKREGRPTDELLVFYVLERFLYRVSRSAYAEHLVLKGGLLLAVLDARRATRDIDLLAMRLDADEQLVAAMVREIASVAVDDGVAFDTELTRLEPIRLDDVYGGVRVIVPARVGGARINLALDVSFGDPVTPEPVLIRFPQLLDEDMVPLLGYPIETVLAEKITTMLALGDLNTRDRDWADVWRLTGGHDLHGETVQNALVRTARHRGVGLGSLANVVAERARVRRVASCIASHQTTMKRELSAAE